MDTSKRGALLEELADDIDPSELVEGINQTELPPSVKKLSNRYNEEIGIRSEFVWKWIYKLFNHCTIGCVPDGRLEATRTRKTLFTMFITIVDDIAEADNDRKTFEQARKIPFPGATVDTTQDLNLTALSLAEDVWSEFTDQLGKAPRSDEFLKLFRYDTRQAVNAMEYSLLVTESPDIATQTGALHYSPHNMVVFPYIDIDQMASPKFARDDLAVLRELFWKAQQMARIGNWISTWEREIHEGDFSSGVVIWALRAGVIEPKDLYKRPETAIEAIQESNIEDVLIDQWYKLYDKIETFDETADSLKLEKTIKRLKKVMVYHLASEGYK